MKSLLFVLVFAIVEPAYSCPSISGTWKSSWHMSMEYNRKYSKLEPLQIELLDQILGHMKISYNENEIHEHGQPKVNVTLSGNEHDFVFEDLKYSYEETSCDINTVKLDYVHPYAGEAEVTLTFFNEDTYWVSTEIMPNSREYFHRVVK